jgi:2-methylcitrate dehydratase PrpD
MTSTNKNPVRAFGSWLASVPRAWPAAALISAHREFIDVVAVMIPGAIEPVTRHVFETVKGWGTGPCTAVGHSPSLAAPWAALVNGTAGHALDFDDNFDPPKAHATTVLAPAILALAEQEGSSGADCLDAYIVGLQILGRVGQGVNPTHRNRGWHATATVGAIGAAAACARLLRLDEARAAHAVSISTSMAAGFMSQFGTMTKPLHAGLAAKSGILAASLARTGVEAGMEVLDSKTGMNRLMVGPDYEQLRDAITNPEHGQVLRFETEHVGEPLLITEHGFRVKRFANCGSAHRAMDGVLAIREEQGFEAKDVAEVHIRAPSVHLNNLMYHDPKTALQSKFSMEYALALALLTGDARLSDFTDKAVNRPETRALYSILRLEPVEKLEGEFPTEVKVTLTDGRSFEKVIAMPLGSGPAPFSTAQYWTKFEGCVDGVLPDKEAARLRSALERLPELKSISELMRHMVWPLSAAA